MNFYEAIGVLSSGIDIETGVLLSHKEKMARGIMLLGIKNVLKCVPFGADECAREIIKDADMNGWGNRPWEEATGFHMRVKPGGALSVEAIPTLPFQVLLRKHHITQIGLTECSCILKEAAMIRYENMSFCEKARAILPKEHIDHYGPNLLLKKTEQSERLVETYSPAERVSTFTTNSNKDVWYEILLAYDG